MDFLVGWFGCLLDLIQWSVLAALVALVLCLILIVFLAICTKLWFVTLQRGKTGTEDDGQVKIGFFHPYCDAGGGGERVLWTGVRALRKRFPAAKLFIYTGDIESAPDQIIARAQSRFNMKIDPYNLEFVYLHRRRWVEAEMFPHFTLLGQSLGSIWLGLEALSKVRPDVFVDTMGYAFTLPLFKYIGCCKVGCYVHYPTISTDMLNAVKSRRAGYNNRSRIANSALFTKLKLIYYQFFAFLYRLAGQCSDLTMVNSSWTEEHIAALWGGAERIHRIYPPCDVTEFKQIERKKDPKDVVKIVSIGQFRPEKDHALQIRAMFALRQIITEEEWDKVRLILIGGCRNSDDERRVQDLKDLCKHLSVENNVEFKVNIPFNELKTEMGEALIGIHSMWNEHFGIAVVEMMAAGLVTLAHRSGGPLMDIVVEDENSRNGFLASHDQEYALAIKQIIDMPADGVETLCNRAKAYVDLFSEREFEMKWLRATESLVNSIK